MGTHAGMKLYSCHFCKKSFSDLNSYISANTGEALCICEMCNKDSCPEERLSISMAKSPDDTKPFLEKSFGCGLCGEVLEIEKEFVDHCYNHRFSPPDDLIFDTC